MREQIQPHQVRYSRTVRIQVTDPAVVLIFEEGLVPRFAKMAPRPSQDQLVSIVEGLSEEWRAFLLLALNADLDDPGEL